MNGVLYFVSKGKKRLFVLNFKDGKYTMTSTVKGLFDGQPDQVLDLTRESSLVYFTEDSTSRAGIHARNHINAYFTILEGLDDPTDETTALAFSPDKMHMYFAMQDVGNVYDVTRTDGYPFDANTINIQYHNPDGARRLEERRQRAQD